jgi:hypothetical protein
MATNTRRYTITALAMLGAGALAAAGCAGTASYNHASGSSPYAKPTTSRPTSASVHVAPAKRVAKAHTLRSTKSGGEAAQTSKPSSSAVGGAAASPTANPRSPAAAVKPAAKPDASTSTRSGGEAAQSPKPSSSAVGGAAASAIPQSDGGDMDADNNGGPSDGDGIL